MPFQGRYIIITIYFALCFAMCLLILVKFILPLESNLVLFASIINLKGSFTKTSVSPGPPILSATKPKLLKYPVITSSQNLTCHSERSAAEESIKKIRYSSSVPCRPFSVIASSAALKVRPLDGLDGTRQSHPIVIPSAVLRRWTKSRVLATELIEPIFTTACPRIVPAYAGSGCNLLRVYLALSSGRECLRYF